MSGKKESELSVTMSHSVKRQFENAKKSIKDILVQQEGKLLIESDPEMAIEVLDEKIRENRPVEQALAAEHLFRKAIEESIPVGIAVFDMKWKQIYVNREFCKMVGCGESELIDRPFPQPYWIITTAPESSDDHQAVLKKILESKNPEIQFRRCQGDPFWGLVLKNRLHDSNGEPIGQLLSVMDITALKKAEKSLKRVSMKLINAQEKERQLLALDLHDSIGGRLTGIKYCLEKIESDLNSEQNNLRLMLKDVVQAVRSTLEETQRITKNLRPSILDDLGLLSAIRDYCRDFQHFYPIIELHTVFDLKEKDVPEYLKILIYRVLQEGMNNAAKHSSAKNVRVRLMNLRDTIELVIKDDGKGFDLQKFHEASKHQGGLGIESMNERTELFGGEFILNSRIGQGTVVRAIWPVSALVGR